MSEAALLVQEQVMDVADDVERVKAIVAVLAANVAQITVGLGGDQEETLDSLTAMLDDLGVAYVFEDGDTDDQLVLQFREQRTLDDALAEQEAERQ